MEVRWTAGHTLVARRSHVLFESESEPHDNLLASSYCLKSRFW